MKQLSINKTKKLLKVKDIQRGVPKMSREEWIYYAEDVWDSLSDNKKIDLIKRNFEIL